MGRGLPGSKVARHSVSRSGSWVKVENVTVGRGGPENRSFHYGEWEILGWVESFYDEEGDPRSGWGSTL